jgi:hypothetical protein
MENRWIMWKHYAGKRVIIINSWLSYVEKKDLHGLSSRANYTNRVTAACRRSDCQLLRIEGATWSALTDPYGRILGFLDRSHYFSMK